MREMDLRRIATSPSIGVAALECCTQACGIAVRWTAEPIVGSEWLNDCPDESIISSKIVTCQGRKIFLTYSQRRNSPCSP